MAFTEDLDEFLSTDDFADVATVTPANGAPSFEVVGIFDDPFMDGEVGEGHLETGLPSLMCKASVAGLVSRGDALIVKGREFSVVQVQPDGTGMAVIRLTP